MSGPERRGTLVLVVGPSGAGKDSIIAGAAELLRTEPGVVFARRLITRPAEAGGEEHTVASSTEFAQARETGKLLLSWSAHGLDYGLPIELAAVLQDGGCVIANVSRSVVAEARERLAPTLAVAVTASPEILRSRLAARGREDSVGIASRLRRAGDWPPDQADVVIENDGLLADAVERFVAVVRARALSR